METASGLKRATTLRTFLRGKLLSKLSSAEVKVHGDLRCDGTGRGWALLADIPKHQILSFC